MALPTSGQLALSAIRDEFGAGTTSNVSLRTLSAAAGLSVPDGLNEFYGLANYLPPSYTSGAASVTGAGTAANPYIITPSWSYVRGEVSNPAPDGVNNWEEVYTNTATMNTITFTNRNSSQQRANVTVTSASSNFCAAVGNPWYYGEYIDEPYVGQPAFGHEAGSCLGFFSSIIGSAYYCADGSTPAHAFLSGQTRTNLFSISSGSTFTINGSGYRDTFLYSYGFNDYYFPCGESNYGQVPFPSVSMTLRLYFEKI